eukprot:TRINITY_DN3715_c1_g1_i1.p1 TRINITY_DN3715_c1_g1~~TRINITY_DN3715_c1_g1_i1.p1  ORF type:complete len:236 (+),score=39.65 TRINITY_DN3715_c1_g1_i1:94-801(+)
MNTDPFQAKLNRKRRREILDDKRQVKFSKTHVKCNVGDVTRVTNREELRKIKNRESAARSRKKKQEKMDDLERQVVELKARLSYVEEENKSLKMQLQSMPHSKPLTARQSFSKQMGNVVLQTQILMIVSLIWISARMNCLKAMKASQEWTPLSVSQPKVLQFQNSMNSSMTHQTYLIYAARMRSFSTQLLKNVYQRDGRLAAQIVRTYLINAEKVIKRRIGHHPRKKSTLVALAC